MVRGHLGQYITYLLKQNIIIVRSEKTKNKTNGFEIYIFVYQ